MITEQERRRRKVTLRFVQMALVMLTVGIGAAFLTGRRSNDDPDVDVNNISGIEMNVPTASALAEGDVQIFNVDSTVDLILSGPVILAGLSPKTVAKVRADMDKSASDASGVGAAIAAAVKEQVADKIGMHVQYDVVDIRDIRLEGDQIVIEWKAGREQKLFGSISTDGKKGDANSFRAEDANRFIEAVKKRKAELLGDGSSTAIIRRSTPRRP